MELDSLKKLKKIQKRILNYIEEIEDSEVNLQNVKQIIDDSNFSNDKDDFRLIILFISQISSNHHRGPFFFDKIEKILVHLKNNITNFFSDHEIFDIFIQNKRVLLFLFEEKIITMDQYIYDKINYNQFYKEYFLPEIQDFLKPQKKEELESDFEEKRKEGENDNYISDLIRKDSVKEFIAYCNKENLPVNSYIKQSIFETNSYISNYYYYYSTKLINYAAFFGAIQIFQYLMKQGVNFDENLWYYAIHSNKPELIHFLEENHVEFPTNFYVDQNEEYIFSLEQSIKCHHNDIANYFINIYGYEESKDKKYIILSECIRSYNFDFILKEIDFDVSCAFYFFSAYKYYNIANILITKGVDVNRKIISISF